ncbi:MAG TPA: hypothetical protein VNV66_20995 [Pilimelia sp.]|nr:hypothetical protein [Pilimelia sp.]
MRTPRAAGACLAVLLLVVGCTSAPSPHAWAATVCTALAPWRAEIGKLAARTQQQMSAATTPAQAKENLVRLLGGAQAASEAARSEVERAGAPAVAGGGDVAREFVASLTAVRDAYGRARASIEELDTREARPFYDRVSAVMEVLQKEYGASAPDTSRLESPELKRAFDEVPECR